MSSQSFTSWRSFINHTCNFLKHGDLMLYNYLMKKVWKAQIWMFLTKTFKNEQHSRNTEYNTCVSVCCTDKSQVKKRENNRLCMQDSVWTPGISAPVLLQRTSDTRLCCCAHTPASADDGVTWRLKERIQSQLTLRWTVTLKTCIRVHIKPFKWDIYAKYIKVSPTLVSGKKVWQESWWEPLNSNLITLRVLNMKEKF